MPIYMQLTIGTDQLPAVQLVAFVETIGNTATFGSATGKWTAQPLIVTMGYDSVLPELVGVSATAKLLPAVQFTFKNNSADGYPTMSVKLTNAVIVSVTFASTGLAPGAELAFIYEKISIESIDSSTGKVIEETTLLFG